jgi:hypothetical protein
MTPLYNSSLPRGGAQVLGTDLNLSESDRFAPNYRLSGLVYGLGFPTAKPSWPIPSGQRFGVKRKADEDVQKTLVNFELAGSTKSAISAIAQCVPINR